jgi:hypothetical protein
MTEGFEFKSQYGQEFSLPQVVQTNSGAHPTSYPIGTWDLSLETKVARA